MRITVKEKHYYGYKQGVKVYIDGIKYPKQRGHVYTEFKNNQNAVLVALLEHQASHADEA